MREREIGRVSSARATRRESLCCTEYHEAPVALSSRFGTMACCFCCEGLCVVVADADGAAAALREERQRDVGREASAAADVKE